MKLVIIEGKRKGVVVDIEEDHVLTKLTKEKMKPCGCPMIDEETYCGCNETKSIQEVKINLTNKDIKKQVKKVIAEMGLAATKHEYIMRPDEIKVRWKKITVVVDERDITAQEVG